MSRHTFHDSEGVKWTVGWDEPLVSYFAQREDASRELQDLAGDKIGDVTTFDRLLERLQGHVELPGEIRAKLQREEPPFTEPAIARAHDRYAHLASVMQTAAAPANQPEVQR